ncbi:Spore cortex-lytic enzyme precursor [compost metagenome]
MVAVASVVFNRVKSERFPNTVTDVIYAKNQFSPVMNGSINKQASEIQYKAIEDALTRDNTNGALFFYAPSLVKSGYMESLTTVAVIGVHHFKK